MPALNRLAPSKVAKLTTPGRHGDGGGLYLQVDEGKNGQPGAKRWVFVYHFGPTTLGGKKPRREMGLGSYKSVSLAGARLAAAEARGAIAEGRDPRAALKIEKVSTFGEVADALIDDIKSQWRGKKTEARWRLAANGYGRPFRDRPWPDVTTQDVLSVLKPIWTAKPEMAQKVREAWERIFDSAKARFGAPSHWQNPARWAGHLKLLLPKRSKLSRGHHRALEPDEVATFMRALRERDGVGRWALAFTLLTGVRTATTLEAVWGEVDLAARTWSIPVGRLKNAEDLSRAGFVHFVIPLSDQAVAILDQMSPLRPRVLGSTDRIFPGSGASGTLSSNTMRAVLIRMGFTDGARLTVHGFRTTLRVWGGKQMTQTLDGETVRRFSDDALEFAIGHVVGSSTQRAYNRNDYLVERTNLMRAWGAYAGQLN